ncbi:MAG: hypothetical protein INQ03_22500 [Candidatus Heimdallarchaeota archaeon]|nr:hypothetical protein [Candidatus Heimdallarchaeota archaeon]
MADKKQLLNFIDNFARFFESKGLSRTKGRILGYLTVAEKTYSTLEDIADFLELSVSTVSPELKQLVDLKLADRLGRKQVSEIDGDRGYVFQVTADTWLNVIDDKGQSSAIFQIILEEGFKVLRDDPPERSVILKEMKILFAYLEKEMPKVLERYREYRKTLD